MARDPQTALVALHRFGLGARGGASGDFGNAASDPRGFVKSELNRPNGVFLEMPGLQSTPALALAVFAFQDEERKAREAAKTATQPSEAVPQPQPSPPVDNRPRRSLSLSTVAKEIAGHIPGMKTQDAGGNAAMTAGETMQGDGAPQPPAAKPVPPRRPSH